MPLHLALGMLLRLFVGCQIRTMWQSGSSAVSSLVATVSCHPGNPKQKWKKRSC